MSLEAFGDEGAGLDPRDWERVVERALEKAAEDESLAFPEDGDLEEIQLEELPYDDWGWRFRATYENRSVEVTISGSILEPSDDDY